MPLLIVLRFFEISPGSDGDATPSCFERVNSRICDSVDVDNEDNRAAVTGKGIVSKRLLPEDSSRATAVTT